MMRRRATRGDAAGKINVTPMIDVVMVLIVFYLMVGKMASDQRADLPLPESGAGFEEPEGESLIIEVRRPDQAGQSPMLSLAGVPMAIGSLEETLRLELSARPGVPIRLRADRSLAYGVIEPVIQAARRAGASTIRLAAERTAEGGPP